MGLLSSKKILVYDYGNYLEVAQVFTRSFETVFYYCPYVINGFPEHEPMDIGRNVPGIIKVKEWASVINEVDMVFFCDCYEADLQNYIASLRIPVFGARGGVEIENNRKYLKEVMQQVGLPYSDYTVVTGIEELSNLLKNKTECFVKSNIRGDMETWKHSDYRLTKYRIDDMTAQLNVFKTQPEYVIDEPVKSLGEIGIDTFVVGGQYPDLVGTGIEIKDTGYVGRIMPYRDLPKQLRNVTDKLASIFQSYNYNGWFSDEVIISEDLKGYLCDATCRLPSPPISLMLEMISNFSDCAWDVANGIVPNILPKSQWGVELIIKSDRAEHGPSPVLVPKEFEKNVKLKNLVIEENGTWVYTPNKVREAREIGSVIGLGNSMKKAIDMATEIAHSIKGIDLNINTDCLEGAKKQIEVLAQRGIKYL